MTPVIHKGSSYPQIRVGLWRDAPWYTKVCHVDLYDKASASPHQLRGALAVSTLADLTRDGLSEDCVRWAADHGRLSRIHRGTYLRAGMGHAPPDLLDQMHAALRVCPPNTVIGHLSAALLLGFGVVSTNRIHVVVPVGSTFPQRPNIRVHQSVVAVGDPVVVLGVPCTPAARCAIDLARTLPRCSALPVLDAALRANACDAEALHTELKLHNGLKGVRQARDLVPLADPRAQCRQESQLRLIIHDGRLTGFQPQLPVRDEDGFARCYLDLADPTTMVAAEYDGSSHLARERLRSDRARHNLLDSLGWVMRYFTDRDLYHRPQHIVATLAEAQNARRSRAYRGG